MSFKCMAEKKWEPWYEMIYVFENRKLEIQTISFSKMYSVYYEYLALWQHQANYIQGMQSSLHETNTWVW